MIVVDTTVWIDFFRETHSAFDRHLAGMIEEQAPVALTDIIYCEVLQGIRDDAQYQQTRDLLRAFPILRVHGLDTFERAATLYRACRKRGLTIRRTADCLIAATCLEAGAALYHNDRDFDAIAKVAPLGIYTARPS
jgi:predicted nucleic acid-binding protein